MKGIASYVPIPRTGDLGGSSTQQADGIMMQDTQQSSGKRIASLIVTPSRQALDDNVTKRPRVSPRLLTFSPTEDVLPVDAQVIGALNDMEITSNMRMGMRMICWIKVFLRDQNRHHHPRVEESVEPLWVY
ncbi:unnamed protein product [Brassica oleracea]